MRRIVLILLALTIALAATATAQESDEQGSQGADTDQSAGAEPQPQRVGFINDLFFTGQFGGGPMASLGAGIAFFENVVRPEVLLGYTVSSGFSGFSVTAKLNARIIGVPIAESVGIFGTIGAGYVFFSSDAQVVTSAFIAEELDVYDLFNIPVITLYFEQDFYFIPTTEGNMLFQLAIGLRGSIFKSN